jgi:hypothetical protein
LDHGAQRLYKPKRSVRADATLSGGMAKPRTIIENEQASLPEEPGCPSFPSRLCSFGEQGDADFAGEGA